MTKKLIKGKKEFMMFIPDVKTHTGHMVVETKFYSFKSVSPKLEWTVKSNQTLFLFKDIPSQLQSFRVFFFAQNADILQPIDSRLVKEIHANAGVIRNVHKSSPKWNIWQKLLASKIKWKVLSSLKNHTQQHGRSNKEIAILKDRPIMSDKKIEQWREESPEDHIYFQLNRLVVVENVVKC